MKNMLPTLNLCTVVYINAKCSHKFVVPCLLALWLPFIIFHELSRVLTWKVLKCRLGMFVLYSTGNRSPVDSCKLRLGIRSGKFQLL